MSELEQREEAVFEAALQLPDEKRAAYLDQICAGDADLRQRVEALLGAFERAGGFMKQPATPERTLTVPLTEKPGDRIGRYKLLQQIGEGGCGMVYLAEQEEPVRRRVALKVIKLGMDTKQVIARFEAERQALALMDHPNIAKVFDAGATDTGRPYFVMELVRGIKITEFCDEHKLSPADRLKLFVQVCQAIQHAHQKGIIHRDIKPSNILVTINDGVPVPKVIDFGIAKATSGQGLTDQTLFTAFDQFIGTPAYMSPEQAQLTSLDIDTRSDIYSLGVLLYELLTGKTPFDGQEMLKAGLDEMRRTICEVEPTKPSTRLTRELAVDVSRRTSKSGADSRWRPRSKELISLLRGDLDWIVMKCLAKERTRRYETAHDLANDIGRHLNGEPVSAAAPSASYRFRKFVRRHRYGLAMAAALVFLLVAGGVVSTWQAVRATRAERQQTQLRQQAEAAERTARSEAKKSREVTEFLKDMLAGVDPETARGRDVTLLREILDRSSERIGKALNEQPEVEANLRKLLGNVYESLGEYLKAEAMLRRALEIMSRTSGKETLNFASLLSNLAVVLERQGKLVEAEGAFREALAIDRKLVGEEHRKLAKDLTNLGNVLWRQNKLAEAEQLQREALVMAKKTLGDTNSEVAEVLGNLAIVFASQHKPTEAEAMFREALAVQRKTLKSDHPIIAQTLANLGNSLADQSKLAEAEVFYREALALRRKVIGSEHPTLAISLNNLGELLARQGKWEEAETAHREALAIRRKRLGNQHAFTALSLKNLARVLDRQGNVAEAETLRREALAIQQRETNNPAK